MYGVSLFAPHGPGSMSRPASLPDIPQIAERRVDHIEARVEAGKLDTATLDKRLQARFGEAAKDIVGDDGAIDFERLEKLITETRSEKLQDRISARFGEDADGIVGSDSSIDKEKLRDLFARERIDHILDRLERRFGDEVKGAVGDDGTIDFDALKEIIAGSEPVSEGATPAPADAASIDGAEHTVPPVTSGEAAISEAETQALRVDASEQLSELRKTLFEARLENRFGGAAERVFNEDGSIDLDALRTLFEEQRPGHPPNRPGHGRGPYLGPPLLDRPFFDFRA
ncbi:MAG: hypothetical protein OEM91_12795 [Hyphomicrobiales bacterium]|nr:hypothetical protein [Hyphomicrobiales bacterium]